MPVWHHACDLNALPEGRAARVVLDDYTIAVVRLADSIAAFSDRCPHAGGALSEGWIEEGELVCPLHRWRFGIDGRCSTMRGEWVRTFRCELRGDQVWIEL